LLTLLGCFSSAALVAPNDAPLIARSAGDLWSWNGAWKRLTTTKNIWSMSLSPDGSRVAYIAYEVQSPERLKACNCHPPFSLHVLELRGGNVRQIAAQTAERNSRQWVNYAENAGLLAWSPDGTRLAWMDQTGRASTDQDPIWNLAVYTLSGGKTQRFTVRAEGADAGDRQLVWTPRGLRIWFQSFPQTRPQQSAVRWYTPSGNALAPEQGAQAGAYFANTRLSLRDPTGPNAQLLDGTRAPLKLGLYVAAAVTSADGSRAVLAGRTPGTVSRNAGADVRKAPGEIQLWLYAAGKLTRVAAPPEFQAGASLAWFGEIQRER
jgi:hypothetical protein